MADNRVRILATLDDKVSTGLDRIRDRFDTLGKSKGFKAVAQGVGLGIGMQLWSQFASRVVDVLGDATEAALAEEESIQRLGTSLRANVRDWDGNTDAIERVLKARMELGFSDDEQRESLSRLVAATGDINRALDIQRTAMDLARFKNISLADATDALTKVEAGSFRILKSLGIALKDGATQTEALAAVQRVAAGQAEDYAETNRGKLLVSQVAIDESMERFGTKTLPLVTSAAAAAADALSGVVTVFDLMDSGIPKTTDAIHDAEQGLVDYFAALAAFPMFGAAFGEIANYMKGRMTDLGPVMTGFAGNVGKAADDVLPDLSKVAGAVTDIHTHASKMSRGLGVDFRAAAKHVTTFKDTTTDSVKDLIDQAFDPLLTQYDLIANQSEQSSLRQQIASGKLKGQALNDAKATLAGLKASSYGYLVDLANVGATTSKAYQTGVADLKTAISKATGPTQTYLQGVLTGLEEIEEAGKVIPLNFKVTGLGKIDLSKIGAGIGRYAEGGVVPGPKGKPQLAVVHGGEYVVSNDDMAGSSSVRLPTTAGAGITVNFQSLWPPTRAQAEMVAAEIERVQFYRRQTAAG